MAATKRISQESVSGTVTTSSTTAELGEYLIPQTEGPFTLSSIFLYVNKVGSPANTDMSVNVWDDSGGNPGVQIALGSAVNTADMTIPGWVEFPIVFPNDLYNGSSYWALVEATWSAEESPASNYWTLGVKDGNPYTAGYGVRVDFGGNPVELSGGGYSIDLAFQIWGTDIGGSPPAQASDPTPADTATGVAKAALALQWATGEDETGQDVYFGPTGDMVLVSENQVGHTYAVGSSELTHNTEYSWRVDTINADGMTEGLVWTFTVAAFAPPADLVVHKFLVAAANSKLFYET